MVITDELREKVLEYARRAEKPDRFAHSLRVAQTAGEICSRCGMDPDVGYFAGLAHDICKDIDVQEMVDLASRDGMEITGLEKSKPSLLHGRAAAVKLKEDFGIQDQDVLDAVAFHTFGKENLCDLGKVVFVADKIEPNRPQSTVQYRENLYSMGIVKMTLSVVEENFEYLEKRGKSIAPESFRFRDSLRNMLGE